MSADDLDLPSEALALLTTAEMAAADQAAAASGRSGTALMAAAGAAVVRAAGDLLVRRGAGRGRILVCCGPGNNGGDGYVAAAGLLAAGFAVRVAALGEPRHRSGDAAAAAAAWHGPVEDAATAPLDEVDLVIDAVFGAGLSRDLDGAAASALTRLARWRLSSGRPLLAVDIPSGLDGSTGLVRGTALTADATITFFRLKPGHLIFPGRAHCGRLQLADIGLPDHVLEAIAPRAFVDRPPLWQHCLPVPGRDGHKYSRGHAVVLSGPAAQTGAARLAAAGALHVGAGLVTVAAPPAALAILAAALTSVMTRVCDGPDALAELLADTRKNAIVMGPGLGVDTAAAAARAVLGMRAPHRAIVLDADALTAFAGKAADLATAIAAAGAPVVLTPHAGEFARLFGPDNGTGKLERARAAAAQVGATVVFKGPDTVIAAPDGRAAIGIDAPPWLATAGSGDVLAGIVGGLLAQGMAPFEAAAAAVWLHGAAATALGPGLVSEDLPAALRAPLAALYRALT